MSAWIVSKEHIDALVTAALKDNLYFYHNDGVHYVKTKKECDFIGNELTKENYKSVNYRYSEDDKAPKYSYEYNGGWKPIEIIKSCHCYGYQSCEHDGWKDSISHSFINALKESLIHELPGYDEAPWGINERKEQGILLSMM